MNRTVPLQDRNVGGVMVLNINRQFYVLGAVCGTWLLQTESVY